MPADPVPGAGLRLVLAEHVLARFERFLHGPGVSLTVTQHQGQVTSHLATTATQRETVTVIHGAGYRGELNAKNLHRISTRSSCGLLRSRLLVLHNRARPVAATGSADSSDTRGVRAMSNLDLPRVARDEVRPDHGGQRAAAGAVNMAAFLLLHRPSGMAGRPSSSAAPGSGWSFTVRMRSHTTIRPSCSRQSAACDLHRQPWG